MGSLTGSNRHAMQEEVRIRANLQWSYYNDSSLQRNSSPASTFAIVKSHHRTGSFRLKYRYIQLGFFNLWEFFCGVIGDSHFSH